MADVEQKKEIRRMVRLLRQTAEFAEHVEQTGSFESGARNSVKRYNKIVEHLEEEEIIHEEMFPKLDDNTDFGTLGAEATALANYLDDLAGEEERSVTSGSKSPDFGWLLGLAPFLEQSELSKLVRSHFTGQPTTPEEPKAPSQGPDLKTIVGLAPHVDSKTLSEMVSACLSRQKLTDPNLLVALAPHMDSRELTQILHQYLPDWFGNTASPPPPPGPAPAPEPKPAPQQEMVRATWGAWVGPPQPGEDRGERE